jgi:uncharacterized membrane protein
MPWTDPEIDRRMGRLLRVGVLTAAGFMLAGGIIFLFLTPEPRPRYTEFHPAAESFRRISKIFRDAFHGRGGALIQVGTFLMIATPVARVAFCVYAFARSHDRQYVTISSIVLALLLYGIFFGR